MLLINYDKNVKGTKVNKICANLELCPKSEIYSAYQKKMLVPLYSGFYTVTWS